MIPLAHIQQWTAHAPWPDLRQVEQDLMICRAICDLFNHPQLQGKIAFRVGTAINKLLFGTPLCLGSRRLSPEAFLVILVDFVRLLVYFLLG